MAETKKGAAGTKAGAGARRGASKANGVAQRAKTDPGPKGASAPRKPAPVKLNDRQREFLTKIHAAGEGGYEVGPRADQRTVDALMVRKLVKKGAKDKETGKLRYLLTRAGHKHLPSAPAPASAASESAPPVEAASQPMA